MAITAVVKASNSLAFEVTADTEPELFKQVARVQEVFSVCPETKFVVRTAAKKSKWLEVVCQDINCKAKLVYSTTEDNNFVYPKTRWDHLSDAQKEQRADEQEYAEKHNGFLPNNGFFKYKK
jgi:hypothetical protein